MPGKQPEIWFYEKFATGSFQVDRAEDWAGLQVMDGNTLKPAMGQGFQGRPSSEQIENLYKMAEAGKLVFFSLTNKQPVAVTLNGTDHIDMNPVEPKVPVDPGEDATKEQKRSYGVERDRYPRRLEIYENAVKVLDNLGAGFKEAVETYNNARDMEAEQTEQDVRAATSSHVEQLRRLEHTDRLINETFGPRPVASAEFFYENVGDHGDFVFKHSEFDQQFAPNGYDLPTDSKLTAQDVATINFAMMGASEFVEKFYKEQLHAGDSYAKNDAAIGFQMLVTGCFGKQRKDQVLTGYGVLDATFKLGKEVVTQYNSGSPDLLGKNLADCVRNIKAVCTGHSWDKVSQDMVAGARVIGRIQELFDKHEDIKQAANLTEKEQQFMRGYVQLGKAYEQHLKSMIKFGDAVARGKALTADEKAEILADAVLRRLVEKDFIADKAIADKDPEYQKQFDAAAAQDFADATQLREWQNANPEKTGKREQFQHMMENDMGIHSTLLSARDLDHGIIFTMAKNGMLEKMRSELMQNPAIRAAAAKEPFEFSGAELEKSKKLDALVAQTEVTKNAWKTQAWYENMKTALSGGNPENWLNPNTPGDNNRLMVGVIERNAKTGAMEAKLVGLDALLEGGVKALENPSQKTLNILYEQAAKGNLYYYEAGKDMPIRVGAENARSTAEQLEVPPKPTLWQTIANILTFGFAYADICNPTPDKDPAVFKAILAARESHSATAPKEAQQPVQENKQVEKKPEQTVEREQKQEQKQNQKEDMIHDQMLGRKLADYNKTKVDAAIARFALADEKYMPAGEKNAMGLTREEVGVLAAIACGSAELSFQDTKSGQIAHNNPDQYYSRIISTHYAEGQQLSSKGAKSFHALARKEVKNALESNDMAKLGRLLADGLSQNNKWLAKQTDLSDYYTVYAELGGKLLDIVGKNEQLKQAFDKHLGENTQQINMAKAAKNISDLRVKVMPLKEQLMKDFTKYQKSNKEGEKDTPLHVSSNEEISTICQLCVIQQSMKMRIFDLATTEYTESNMVNEVNDFLKDSTQLEIFRTKSDYREVTLDDVSKMVTLYSGAINIKKVEMAEQKQAQIVADKQNEKQIEQPEMNIPTA